MCSCHAVFSYRMIPDGFVFGGGGSLYKSVIFKPSCFVFYFFRTTPSKVLVPGTPGRYFFERFSIFRAMSFGIFNLSLSANVMVFCKNCLFAELFCLFSCLVVELFLIIGLQNIICDGLISDL